MPRFNKVVLFIGFTWPEPTSTATGTRILQLIQFFQDQKYRTVFCSTASETTRSLNLKKSGVEKVPIKLNDSGFDDFLEDLHPDIVVFDRFLTEEQFGWRVWEFAPQALRILDTEDLHSLRYTRQELFKKDIPFSIDSWLGHDTTKREIASIYRSDLSLIISSFEMDLLIETLKIDKNLLLHLPFMLDSVSDSDLKNLPTFAARKDFVCIGNGKHAPNIDAILCLKKEIWPQIRKQLPKVNVHIYGAYLPERIQQMHHPEEGFYVHGWAENAFEVLRKARVELAPLRFGAGIKGKLIEAMQTGTPSVTTPIGAEGMHGDLPWSGAVTHSAEDFAEAAIQLYQQPEKWKQGQENGKVIIDAYYDKRTLKRKLETTLSELSDSLKAHRNRNFIGSMLMHHTVSSTKYLAKWIAAKNRKS